MQADPLTFNLDVTGGSTPADESWVRAHYNADRSTYHGPDQTLAARQMLQLYRTPAKRNGEYRGTSRSTIKVTQDIEVENASGSGDLVAPLIGEINFAAPVGATEAQTMALRQRLAAVILNETVAVALVDDLIV